MSMAKCCTDTVPSALLLDSSLGCEGFSGAGTGLPLKQDGVPSSLALAVMQPDLACPAPLDSSPQHADAVQAEISAPAHAQPCRSLRKAAVTAFEVVDWGLEHPEFSGSSVSKAASGPQLVRQGQQVHMPWAHAPPRKSFSEGERNVRTGRVRFTTTSPQDMDDAGAAGDVSNLHVVDRAIQAGLTRAALVGSVLKHTAGMADCTDGASMLAGDQQQLLIGEVGPAQLPMALTGHPFTASIHKEVLQEEREDDVAAEINNR